MPMIRSGCRYLSGRFQTAADRVSPCGLRACARVCTISRPTVNHRRAAPVCAACTTILRVIIFAYEMTIISVDYILDFSLFPFAMCATVPAVTFWMIYCVS